MLTSACPGPARPAGATALDWDRVGRGRQGARPGCLWVPHPPGTCHRLPALGSSLPHKSQKKLPRQSALSQSLKFHRGSGRARWRRDTRDPPSTTCKNSGTWLNSSGPQLPICQMGTGRAATLGRLRRLNQPVGAGCQAHSSHSTTSTTLLGGLCSSLLAELTRAMRLRLDIPPGT